MRIAGWIVLHEIACEQYNIGRPDGRTLSVGKRSLERGQGCDPTQCFRLAAIEMRTGELYAAQAAHDFDIRQPNPLGGLCGAGRVPPACNQSVTEGGRGPAVNWVKGAS